MIRQHCKKAKQEETILTLLHKRKQLKTTEAAQLLNVSECTVRRFFMDLEQRNEAIRIYGGIKLPPAKSEEYRFDNYQFHKSEQKRRIGQYASTLVHDGDILFIDSGTTMQQMTLCLAERLKAGELHNIQVFTNSLRNLQLLADICDVSLIGGLFRSQRQDFCGYVSEIVLEVVSFEKCFLSADGIYVNPGDGVMAMDIFTAKINQLVSHRAREVYLVADSSKFSRRSFIKYTSLDKVSMVISDSGLSAALAEEMSACGPKIVVV